MSGEPTGDTEPLYVGSIVGGGTISNRRWRDAIGKLTEAVAARRKGVVSALNLNVVFQVPGEILRPDFEGVRTGHFSKKHRLLMVQVALPEDVPSDPDGYVRDALVAAIAEAEGWALRRHVAPNLNTLREFAKRL